MSKKCLECGAELTSSEAIIFHTCEAYPQVKSGNVWIDVLSEKEGN